MSGRYSHLVILGSVLAACESAVDKRVPATSDYAVYAAAIDSIVRRAEGDEHLVLISPTVGDGPEGMASVEAMRDDGDVPPDVRADFMAKNARRVALRPESLAVGIRVTIVPRDSVIGLSNDPEEYWTRIRAKFPGAQSLVSVSRVGFSRDSSHALLYLDRTCGELCGTGWKIQLRRRSDGTWRILAADPVWYL